MTVIEALLRSDPEAIHPVTRAIVGAADKLSAADAFRGLYRLTDLKRITGPAIDGVDLLAVPTIPSVCSVTDVAADPIGPNSRLGTYTNFVNLLDLCGIAVPTETMSDGRPGSVTFLARAGRDGLAAAVAARLAGAEPAAPAPMAGEVALAVVGAHLSGMPLNHEVTSRGGRFLEATRTSADYKLYALPGGPPERPGLVRSRAGSAIDLELWALPEAGFGAFVAGVPSPLCIGTLELEDGRKVKGFLAEALAIEGARDISDFGGWRAYTAARHAG